MGNESLISKIFPVSIVAAGVGASALPLRSDPPAPGSHLTGQDYADFWASALSLPADEQARLVIVTHDLRILPAYPELIQGWIVTSTEGLEPIEGEIDGQIDGDGPIVDVISGEMEGEIIVVPPGWGGTTGTLTGGGTGGWTTGGTTGSTSGSTSGQTTGGSTGMTSGGSSGSTAGGTSGSTTGSTSGSTSGTSTGGSTGTTGSNGTSTTGSSSGTTGSGTTGSGSTGSVGMTTGSTTGGGAGTGGGGTVEHQAFVDGCWNWEDSLRPVLHGAGFPPTHLPNGAPHDSGFYRRVMTREGRGQVSADLELADYIGIHCSPLFLGPLGQVIPDQFREVPYQYLKLDYETGTGTAKRNVYAESGFKYELWYKTTTFPDGRPPESYREDPCWKPYLTIVRTQAGQNPYRIDLQPGGFDSAYRRWTESDSAQLELSVVQISGVTNIRAEFKHPNRTNPIILMPDNPALGGDFPTDNKCKVGYCSSIAQHTAIVTNWLTGNVRWWKAAKGVPKTKANIGSWFVADRFENPQVARASGGAFEAILDENVADSKIIEKSRAPNQSGAFLDAGNWLQIFTGVRQ